MSYHLNDNELRSLDNGYLRLMIMPTEQCNFRCKYCYEDFTRGKMRQDVVGRIKKLIKIRLPELHTLRLSWFGGEPLLAKGIIYDLHDYCRNEAGSGTQIVGDITTNGFGLNLDTFYNLVSRGVGEFSISLDGFKGSHNITRSHIVDGTDTFTRIWNNLLAIRDCPLQYYMNIRIHHHPQNMDEMPDFVDELSRSFFYDQRFSFLIEPIKNLGSDNLYAYTNMRDADRDSAYIRSLLNQNSLTNELESKNDYVCYAASPNNYLIRKDGALSKCTVALDKEINRVGFIQEDGSLSLNTSNLQFWNRGILTGDKDFMECPNAYLKEGKVQEYAIDVSALSSMRANSD